MMLFAIQDILLYAVLAGVVVALALLIWPWARARGRFAIAGLTTFVGFVAWYLTLNATNGKGFNVDFPVIPFSWADLGSGVLAFTVSALVLGLIFERSEPAGRVVGAAAIAGLLAALVDLFVL